MSVATAWLPASRCSEAKFVRTSRPGPPRPCRCSARFAGTADRTGFRWMCLESAHCCSRASVIAIPPRSVSRFESHRSQRAPQALSSDPWCLSGTHPAQGCPMTRHRLAKGYVQSSSSCGVARDSQPDIAYVPGDVGGSRAAVRILEASQEGSLEAIFLGPDHLNRVAGQE
jgi:hypothetical protein